MRLHMGRCWQSALTLACLAAPARAWGDVVFGTGYTMSMVFQCPSNLTGCSTTSPSGHPAENVLTLTDGGGSITFEFLGESGAVTATNAEVRQIFLGTLVSTLSGPFSGFPDDGRYELFSVDLNLLDRFSERGSTVFHGGVYLAHDGTGNAYLSFFQPIWRSGSVVTFLQYPPNDLITPTNNRVDLFGYEVVNFLPEPSTISLTLSGLAILGVATVRRRRITKAT